VLVDGRVILDTNVVSETMRQDPDPRVMSWLDAQEADTLFLTTVAVAELGFGIAALPPGRRRAQLEAFLREVVERFHERILPFDLAAADQYARLAARARALGRGFPLPDAYVAAIAAAHGCTVASRDQAPFVAAGVSVVDPWRA